MAQKILIGCCLSLFLLWGLTEVHAQTVKTYLADNAPTVTRVLIDAGEAADQSWWSKLRSYLGIRSDIRIRPKVGTVLHVVSSAYASSPYQTDASPCITAAGTSVRPGVVATNFLPLGTILSIEGDKYIVEDRMNSRYQGYYMDIWFPSTSEALEFGRKKLEITILGYGKPGDVLEESPAPSPEAEKQSPPPLPKTFWVSLTQSIASISDLLSTKSYSDPNRNDVDCFP